MFKLGTRFIAAVALFAPLFGAPLVLVAQTPDDLPGIEQPLFAYAAPDDCWLYSSWNGGVNVEPNSKNSALRILAEPSVQRFLVDVQKRIGMLPAALQADKLKERIELLKQVGTELTNAIFTKAGCFFVEELEVDTDGPSGLKALLIMDMGNTAKTTAENISKLNSQTDIEQESVTIKGIRFNRFAPNESAEVEVLIGSTNGKLIIGTSRKTMEAAFTRMNKKHVAPWLREYSSHRGLKQISSLSYLNLSAIKSSLVPLLGEEFEESFKMIGMDNVTKLETCSGYSQQGFVNRFLLGIKGPPQGLLNVAPSSGLQHDDLQLRHLGLLSR